MKKLSIHENASEIIVCKMAAILSRGRWVKYISPPPPQYQQYKGRLYIILFVITHIIFCIIAHANIMEFILLLPDALGDHLFSLVVMYGISQGRWPSASHIID